MNISILAFRDIRAAGPGGLGGEGGGSPQWRWRAPAGLPHCLGGVAGRVRYDIYFFNIVKNVLEIVFKTFLNTF